MSEDSSNGSIEKAFSGPALKYVVLIFSIFLVVLGSMSIYEGQKSAADDRNENISLIVISSLMLVFAILALLLLIYVSKVDTSLSFTKLYLVFLLIAFGVIISVVAIICSIDAPNNNGRATLLWIMGTICVISGVIGIILSSLFIAKAYGAKGLSGLDRGPWKSN